MIYIHTYVCGQWVHKQEPLASVEGDHSRYHSVQILGTLGLLASCGVCYNRLEKHARDEHTSLRRKQVAYGRKSFITLAPGLLIFKQYYNNREIVVRVFCH